MDLQILMHTSQKILVQTHNIMLMTSVTVYGSAEPQ